MTLVVIMGPPAVGKMTVGKILAELTGFKLFHNHMTIELLVNFFDYGSEKFNKLTDEFRGRIFEEVSSSDIKGLIFTYVVAFNDKEERDYLESVSKIFKNDESKVYYVELEATLEERLKRNKGISRLEEKPSKRDLIKSEKGLLAMEKKWLMNTSSEFPFFFKENYLKIENSNLSALDVAKKIRKHFNL